MGIFNRKPQIEKRNFSLNKVLDDLKTKLKYMTVNSKTSLKVPTAWACMQLISNTIATMPLHLYRVTPNGKERLKENIFNSKPNPFMTSFTFKQTLVLHLINEGNCFIFKEKAPNGSIKALYPINPNSIKKIDFDSSSMKKLFTIEGLGVITSDDILHIPYISIDGITGLSLVKFNLDTLQQEVILNAHTSSFFSNSASLSGFLSTEATLSEKALANLEATKQNLWTGNDNTGAVAILQEGLKFYPLTVNAKDAQLLEAKRFSKIEIASLFGVPPSFLGIDGTNSYASLEMSNQFFLQTTLLPVIKRLENAFNSDLLYGTNFELEFSFDTLFRPLLVDRVNAYSTAIQSGQMTINQVQDKEGRPHVEGGDITLVMGNNLVELKTLKGKVS